MTQSLIIRGPMLCDGKVSDLAARCEGGVIVAVAARDVGAADQEIELDPGQVLMPAGVETLCAMRDWAEEQRDTVDTVTRAALAAGVTVVSDQANTVPRLNTAELVRKRAGYVAERTWTDFTINAHPPVDPSALADYKKSGVFSLQLFPWEMAPWNEPRDTDVSPALYSSYAHHGFEALFFPDEHALRNTPWRDHGEGFALKALLRRLPPDLPARILITLADSVEQILAARPRLPRVKIAVAPHTLFISREEGFRRIGLGATQVPPLRSQPDVDAMRVHAEAGNIDIVCSHHGPHRMGDKYSEQPIEGEFAPKGGYSAIDITYPLLMTRLGLPAAARLYSENPSVQLNIKKGRIAKGYDADFAIVAKDGGGVDKGVHEHGGFTDDVWKVDPTLFQSKGKVTPFVGERLSYQVRKTFLRGALVYDFNGQAFHRTEVRQVRRS